MSAKLPLNVTDLKPRITVIGVGGAGCNAVNNMIDASLDGVEFVVANTDAQSLVASHASSKIQLGARLTEGLGAGSRPDIGEAAAIETIEEIRELVRGSHMVFVAAGMGGGTGTGAAAVIARAAREQNILTVGVVTKPFQFEGSRRMRIAEAGIAELRKHVDTLIVIPNQNLFRIASERTTFAEAFVLADQVLYSGVACIVDLIVKDGLINLDFADVRTVMTGMGNAMMGTGEASGDDRAVRAAEEAISNPLLDDVSLAGAKGLLLSITGGSDLTLYEVDEAATRVRQEVDPDANIIVGATTDPSLGDRVRVSIVASGMDRAAREQTAQTATLPPALPVETGPVHQPAFTDEDRLAAVLRPSQAYDELTRGLPSQPQHPVHPLPEAGPHPAARAPSWHSGDDIEITELTPGTMAPPPFGSPQSGHVAPYPAYTPREDFVPAPPAQVRRPPRRMPELGDFPEVGQRDYQAKTQRSSPATHGPAPSPSSQPPATRKKTLFERLTGRVRRESDSQFSPPAERAPSPYHQHAGERSYSVGADAPGHRPAAHDDGRERQDRPDLPAFFNTTRGR